MTINLLKELLLTTRRIASLRIHVERAIGKIKNYKILNDIPNNMARIADQLFFVCAMLCICLTPLYVVSNFCYKYLICSH